MTLSWPRARRPRRGPGTSLFPWAGWLLDSVSSDSTPSVFLSQPQISSSILVRVPSERLSHLSLPDFLNYKWYLHIIHICSSVTAKAEATVCTEYRVSISYELNPLRFSLFPFFCFTLVFPTMGFALLSLHQLICTFQSSHRSAFSRALFFSAPH